MTFDGYIAITRPLRYGSLMQNSYLGRAYYNNAFATALDVSRISREATAIYQCFVLTRLI